MHALAASVELGSSTCETDRQTERKTVDFSYGVLV